MPSDDFAELRSRPTDPRALRGDLARSIVDFASDEEGGRVRFRGSARFGRMLEGPPGRLHGGLHAYARLFPVLDRIDAHDPRTTYPCRITMTLGRFIELERDVAFEGTYAADAHGYRLDVRHAETERLDASLASEREPEDPLPRFRDAYLRARHATPLSVLVAERDLPTRIHPELVVIEADRAARARHLSLAAYLTETGTVDAAFVCVLLDVAAAVVLGWEVQGRCFTVRMDLVVRRAEVPADVDLVALGDRRTRPDLRVASQPVQIGELRIGPTEIGVLLADTELTTAYAHGTITLVPARRA